MQNGATHNHLSHKLPHRSVFLAALAIAFCLLGDQALYSVLPIHFQKLGLLPYQVGILLSANRWIRLLTNHLAEKLTRLIDPLILFPASLVLGAILTVSYGTFSLFVFLLGARLLWGFSWSCQRQIGVMASVAGSTADSTARSIGIFNGIVRIGSVGGLFMGALLYDTLGFTRAFLILAAISIPSIPLGFVSQKMRLSTDRLPHSEEKSNPIAQFKFIFFAGFVIGCVGPGLIASTLGYILKEQVGDTLTVMTVVVGIATINGLLLSSQSLINTLGAPFLGVYLDWFGHQRGTLLFFSIATCALAGAVIATNAIILMLLVLLYFICEAAIPIMLYSRAGRDGPKTLAAMATFSDLGAAVGPIVGWTVLEFITLPKITFIIGAVLYGLATVLSLREFSKINTL